MTDRLETAIVDSIVTALRRIDKCWVFKVHGGPYQVMGIPDLVGCIHGRFFAIEVKRPGKGPTRVQAAVIEMIQQAGGVAGVATNREEGVEIALSATKA